MDKARRTKLQTNSKKYANIAICLVLFLQLIILFRISTEGGGETEHHDGEYVYSEVKKTTYLNCEDIQTMDECSARMHDCIPLHGSLCKPKTTSSSSTTIFMQQNEFIECVSVHNYSKYITFEDKEVYPAIPKWSSPHPDSQYICSINPTTNQLYRFEHFAPRDWQQRKCVTCNIVAERNSSNDRKISLVTLVYRELDSFNNSLISWQRNGLFDLVDETIVYINKMKKGDEIYNLAQKYNLRILGSEENIGIGKAIAQLVLHAKNNIILFLEKDWEAIESRDEMRSQLEASKNLLLSNINGSRADAVKLRSRWNAGRPNIDYELCIPPDWDTTITMWEKSKKIEDKEEVWSPHLFCNIFHFESDDELLKKYPQRLWRCGSNDVDFLCFDSAQCGWTNNPMLFRRYWFIDNLYGISQRSRSFEGGTYYSEEWIYPHWVVAQPNGFFMHHEINEHDD